MIDESLKKHIRLKGHCNLYNDPYADLNILPSSFHSVIYIHILML